MIQIAKISAKIVNPALDLRSLFVSESALNIVGHPVRWIGVAALDWASAGLVGFYPDDVPQEWQLTWYANFCMAVVVPPDRWLEADPDLIAQWCEQTQSNFWFYLLCDTSEQVSQAVELSRAFSVKFAGLLLSEGIMFSDCNVTMLQFGSTALRCTEDDLRSARVQINSWLATFSGDHGLIVLDGSIASQIKEVQTLLELMGVLS